MNHRGKITTYQSQPNPRFSQVDQNAVLRPPPRSSDLLNGEIIAVLLQVNLYNQGNSIDYKYPIISVPISRKQALRHNSRFP